MKTSKKRSINQEWEIRGFDGLNLISEVRIPVGMVSETNIKIILQCLVSKYGLSDKEIVCSLARSGTRYQMGHLKVTRELYPIYKCGDNPHFIARIVLSDSIVSN